jgi:hypothetical protein
LVIHGSVLQILEDMDAVSSTPVGDTSPSGCGVIHRSKGNHLGPVRQSARVPDLPGPKFAFRPHHFAAWPYLFGPRARADFVRAVRLAPTSDLASMGMPFSTRPTPLHFHSTDRDDLHHPVGIRLPVVIILQSDHGPSPGLDWEPEPDRSGEIRHLNAYYVPEQCEGLLYPGISPVNTFRVIFNCLFDQDMPLLEDVTYFGIEEFYPLDDVIAH